MQRQAEDPEVLIRIVESRANNSGFAFIWDIADRDDEIVEHKGKKLLLVKPRVAARLRGKVIDHRATIDREGFMVLSPDSVAY